MTDKSIYDRIYEAVLQIPFGRVATYGQIAVMAGNKNYARIVGNALHRNPAPGVIPCHRVVNAKGSDEQKKLLESENIEVKNNLVDLQKYQMR